MRVDRNSRHFQLSAIILQLVIVLGLTSCETILQYPDEPETSVPFIKTRVELAIDFTPINDPLLASYADSRAGDFDVRYQVVFYALTGVDAGKIAARKVWTSNTLETGATKITADIEVLAEQYEIYAWVDFVPGGTTDDYHYITSDIKTVQLSNPNVHGIDTRDAFSGKTSYDLSKYNGNESYTIIIPIQLERPFGKFKIVTTDVKKFLDSYRTFHTYADIMPSEATVTYTCYFPTAYNLDTRMAHVDMYQLGVNHTNDVIDIEDNTAVLSSNYILICNDNTMVTAQLEVHNAQGEVLARVGNITIPIQRNKNTIVSGEFLSAGISGGTVINPDFDGAFNIEL